MTNDEERTTNDERLTQGGSRSVSALIYCRSSIAIVALCFISVLAAFIALPSLLDRGAAARDEVYERIVARGTLRVGMDASFPPFESLDAQALVGFDVELANELARRMNLRAEFVTSGFDSLYPELSADHFDVIISALPFDRLRTRDVAYSDIYFRGGEVLLVRADENRIQQLSDLRGQVVGVEFGSSAETLAKQFERRSGYRVQNFSTLDEAELALERGDVQGVIADAVSARLMRRVHGQLRIADQPVGSDPNYVIAMPITSPQLLAAVNKQLRAMDKDGTLKMLIEKWF